MNIYLESQRPDIEDLKCGICDKKFKSPEPIFGFNGSAYIYSRFKKDFSSARNICFNNNVDIYCAPLFYICYECLRDNCKSDLTKLNTKIEVGLRELKDHPLGLEIET